MHEIYRNAECVYVWLGLAQEYSNEAMHTINQDKLGEYKRGKPLAEALLKHRSETSQMFTMDLFKSILHLSRRIWFHRLWVAQEYLFARSIKFICGNSISDGAQFLGVLMKFTTYSFGETPSFGEGQDFFDGFITLRELDKGNKSLENPNDCRLYSVPAHFTIQSLHFIILSSQCKRISCNSCSMY